MANRADDLLTSSVSVYVIIWSSEQTLEDCLEVLVLLHVVDIHGVIDHIQESLVDETACYGQIGSAAASGGN